MLCWLDLETEGLDPRRHLILELGMIITDDELVEVARKDWVLHLARDRADHLEPIVWQMHAASGLLGECEKSDLFADDVESQALTFVRDLPRGEVPLCGSTIGFDRRFLAEHMPALLAHFSYRSIDVSTLTELARRWFPEAYEARPGAGDKDKPHRALADLDFSIAALKFYRVVMMRNRAEAKSHIYYGRR